MPDFVCPECGSNTSRGGMSVSTDYVPDDPISHVLSYTSCEHCRYWIPTHLCELWDDMSADDARVEWREVFRETATRDDE